MEENPPAGSRVLDRDTRDDLGSWDELSSELGEVIGEEGIRYLDGFFQL